MARDTYQAVSPIQSLIFVNAVQHYLVTPGLAYTFFGCAYPEFWTPVLAYADLVRIPAPHAITFLNGAAEPDLLVPEPQPSGPPLLLFNPAVIFPQNADKPLTGQGIYNSGLIDPSAPGPHSFSLKIGDISGNISYECLLYDSSGMKGRLTVAPNPSQSK
jgi:hypothetical protein